MTSPDQIANERLMSDLGRERYWAKVHANAKHGHATRTPVSRYLLRESVASVTKAVTDWRQRAKRGKAGPAIGWSPLLAGVPSSVVSMIAVRCVLDVSAKPVGMAAAANMVGRALEEEVNFRKMRKAAPHLFADLKKRLLASSDRRRRRHLVVSAAQNMTLPLEGWTRRQVIAIGASLIELVAQNTGLVELKRVPQRGPRGAVHSKSIVTPTMATLEWLEKAHEKHEVMFPFYLPTVELPVAWENPFDGGYHTNLLVRRPLVKTGDRKSLKLLADSSPKMGDVYRAVNALQDTPWEINTVVHEVARHFWSSGIEIAGIPDRVDDPPLPRPPEMVNGTPEHKAWRAACGLRNARVQQAKAHRVLASKVMFMAERFEGRTFFYPQMLDFRGRVYPVPFFLQPQGSSLARGLLRFAYGAPLVTQTAKDWYMVHGANCFGVDKVSFEERIRWVKDNLDKITAVHTDPIDCRWWADASKPWEFLAWCLEFVEIQRDPLMESKIPIAMDGSNNGLQLFSLLMRDPEGAEATNCTASDAPRDIYQEVADVATAALLEDTDPMAAQWIGFCGGRLPREAVKRQVMTMPYGCSFHSCIHFTRDWYEDARKKKGSTPFGPGYGCSNYLATFIWKAIATKVGKARECMDWLRACAKLVTDHEVPVQWTAPTGFPVRQEYTKYTSSTVQTSIGEKLRTVQFRGDNDEVHAKEHVSGVAPNFVHSLDAALLVNSVILAQDAGVNAFAMVHDSYGVLAADAETMSIALREAAVGIFSTDQLQRFHADMQALVPRGVIVPEPPALGDLDPGCVIHSPYFFA